MGLAIFAIIWTVLALVLMTWKTVKTWPRTPEAKAVQKEKAKLALKVFGIFMAGACVLGLFRAGGAIVPIASAWAIGCAYWWKSKKDEVQNTTKEKQTDE